MYVRGRYDEVITKISSVFRVDGTDDDDKESSFHLHRTPFEINDTCTQPFVPRPLSKIANRLSHEERVNRGGYKHLKEMYHTRFGLLPSLMWH